MSVDFSTIVSKLQERESRRSPLTPKETELLRLLCRGEINKTASFTLGITERTVEVHRQRIMEKLGAKSPVHLGVIAVMRGLV